MTTQLDMLIEFKTQFTTFFDELIAQFPREGDLVVMRLYIATQMDIANAVNTLLHEMNTNNGTSRKAVKDRDEAYFINYNISPETNKLYKLHHFKTLWRSKTLDNDDKQIIWSWIDTFILMADKYGRLA
jgi:hypothetical protein